MKPRPGDVFCVYNRTLERYTACQVTKVKEKGVVELVLDWTGPQPLSPEELPVLRPLVVDYLFWSGGYDLTNVPLTVPGNYIRVGNIPPLVEEDSRSYSGWDGGHTIARQRWWDSIPEEKRRAFKAAAAGRGEVEIGGQPVKERTSKVRDDLIPFGDCRELRPLRCLTALECTRWHPGLVEYLKETPFLIDLRLENHGQKRLDLRGTTVRRLLIDPEGLAENLENPFRHWDGMEGVPAGAAKRAAGLYKKLRKELLRLAGEQPEDAQAQAEAAVTAFVRPFNRMRFIETEEREDVYSALCGLLEELPESALDRRALVDAFEAERDF